MSGRSGRFGQIFGIRRDHWSERGRLARDGLRLVGDVLAERRVDDERLFGGELFEARSLVDAFELPEREIEALGEPLPGFALLDDDGRALATAERLEIGEKLLAGDRQAAHVRLGEVRRARQIGPVLYEHL